MLAHMPRWKTENATPFYYIMRTRLGHTCRPFGKLLIWYSTNAALLPVSNAWKVRGLLWTLHCKIFRKICLGFENVQKHFTKYSEFL